MTSYEKVGRTLQAIMQNGFVLNIVVKSGDGSHVGTITTRDEGPMGLSLRFDGPETRTAAQILEIIRICENVQVPPSGRAGWGCSE